MLDVEHKERDTQGKRPREPFTYADYLRVPEILDLQSPLSEPQEHDELLFIIVQQIQELWFKQVLFELRSVIELMGRGELLEAVRLVDRVNKIMRAVAEEATVLETMPPQEFHRFRHVLTTSSGLESEQFRELEWASGLRDGTFLKIVEKLMGEAALRELWPVSLHDAFLGLLRDVNEKPAEAVAAIYNDPQANYPLYMLAEALSEYEVVFHEWRFHHVKLVERTIGDHSPGTAGSAGAGYLGKTLGYRFFPELWEGRNLLTARAPKGGGASH
jgi:tryptophan 2,3-dioxygenase